MPIDTIALVGSPAAVTFRLPWGVAWMLAPLFLLGCATALLEVATWLEAGRAALRRRLRGW